jgi:hypothetical protein
VYGQAGKFVHIRKTSDNTLFESISANGDGNGLYPNGTTNPALITGNGTSLIRVTPSHTPEFQNNTEYYVTVDSGAFLNASGAAFVGLTNTTDLSFTTIALTCEQKMEMGQTCEQGDIGPGGGEVFYTSGTGATQYMEVGPTNWYDATSRQTFTWCAGKVSSAVPAPGTATQIGSGAQNTPRIATFCNPNGAAHWIVSRNNSGGIGGKTDWFLPSKDELNYLCLYARQLPENADTCTTVNTLRTGFLNQSYWSSSEFSATRVWYHNFSNGGQAHFDGSKDLSLYVRPVRSFAQAPCAWCAP